MTGISLSIQEAKNDAKKVLLEHTDCVENLRLDVKLLAKKMGMRLVPKDDLEDQSVSGYLHMPRNTEKPLIVINSKQSEARQRFTIAHEIGHYRLHKTRTLHVDDLDTTDLIMFRDNRSSRATHLVEITANQFAAELLMPEEQVRTEVERGVKKNKGMSELVEDLAKAFDVSQAAMAIRLSSLGVVK